ncbi:uncharacterized protein LOC133306075 [Gastrolobium bilobum]|uniref:uncharacterized protein LOC133306075 n=1 Tax=Gastrolobium bilobum TaxID=150636 RepID=UPI002AAFCF78|nr:uncharacterized protein LOC133306075 [Gastrolobium bilobum]
MVAAWSDSESEEEKFDEDAQANLYLMVHSDSETADEPQEAKVRGNNLWYLDSGCSKHMTGDKSRFLSLMPFQGGNVTFGDDKKGEIIGIGKVGKSPSHCIDNVFLVKGLKHNLLSISQFCDKDYDPLLWHRRLGHASLSTLKKLSSLDLVVGLPSIKVEDNQLCEACARGKHVKSSFKSKNMVSQSDKGTMIHQQKYLKDLLKKYGMEASKPHKTPMGIGDRLSEDKEGKSVDEKMYRGMIGSLLYLTASRPDIVFSVGLCARFQSNPKESHLKSVKQILRYLKGFDNLGLWYPRGANFDLVAYSDADFAGDLVHRKSTSGMAQFLGPCLVTWGSKKQNTIALSTTEAEYISAALCCAQLLWIKQQLIEFGINFGCMPILCDNSSAIRFLDHELQVHEASLKVNKL